MTKNDKTDDDNKGCLQNTQIEFRYPSSRAMKITTFLRPLCRLKGFMLRAVVAILLVSYIVTTSLLVPRATFVPKLQNETFSQKAFMSPAVKSKFGGELGTIRSMRRALPIETEIALSQIHGTKSSQKVHFPSIYQGHNWDGAPIVVEEYKLLFFTQGKVACTEFKKLLRRMMRLEDWKVHKEPQLPHDPSFNGLNYLYYYSWEDAETMLKDPAWTRALFVREPKERFLSAYLDKAVRKDGVYLDRHCCQGCGKRASTSIQSFLNVVKSRCCCDVHWKPQSKRIDSEYQPYVNFVGYFENLAQDTRNLLMKIGAWEEHGASGWGKHNDESIFMETSHSKHRTGASTKLSQYYNDTLQKAVEEFYKHDYHLFGFEARAS